MMISFAPYIPFSISAELLLILILSICLIAGLVFIIKLNNRIKRMLKGGKVSSIEESLVKTASELQDLIEFRKESEDYLTTVESRLRNSIQSVETQRFNAFKGTGAGGNQSFATAFMNENGDGLIISTIYSSDRVSVFGKPVSKFVSTFELTEEERDVLENANKKLPK